MRKKRMPPPPKVYTKNTKTQQHSLLSTLAQGASFGAGSEVGHTLVKSMFGTKESNNVHTHRTQSPNTSCTELLHVLTKACNEDTLMCENLIEKYYNTCLLK